MGSGNQVKYLSALKQSHHFRQADESSLESLLAVCQSSRFAPGQVVIDHGVENDRIFLILEGEAQVVVHDELILTLTCGDLIGEMSVISGAATVAKVVALEPLELLWFREVEVRAKNNEGLTKLLERVFLSILTEKLKRTTHKAEQYEGTKKALNLSQAELKHTERSLKTQEEILSSVLKSMSEGVVVIEPTDGALHVNAGFLKMVGQPQVPSDLRFWPEHLGLYLPDQLTLYPTQDLPMATALLGKMVQNQELFVKNPQVPEGRWLLASSRLMTDDLGDPCGAVVMFFDYTTKKAEEAALIAAKNHAEQEALAKASFLSMVTHELGTPLNAVIGMTDLLLNSDLPPSAYDLLMTIKGSSEGLLTLIRNLLEYNQMEAGSAQLSTEPLELDQALENTALAMVPMAKEKGLTLLTQFSPGLGEVVADRKRLMLVIFNLLHNAIKFTHQGQITLGCKPVGENFLFFVSDTGIGIDPALLGKLSQPFFQAETGLSRKYQGIGLGLVLSRKLVQLMGGELTLESELGLGTKVRFTLPLQRPQQPGQHSEDAKDAYQLGTEFAQKYPFKILIAEDNKANAVLVRKVLEKLGYQSEWAMDGRLALKAALAGNFDLILMDIQMPEMDGLESTEQINRQMGDKAPRIVALTANTEDPIRQRCQELGMSGFLTKPLRVQQLAETLISLQGA
ncbi:MAG: hypothetical protein A2600_06775 [Candidatus Lambdaproteobacteria bacterium RIFOXYD1_FULL_56_27]|uniref:histidine kinase n=1 Tax=Candidatus Lambdaproteobacteria bacterium RIFOXYD2_FULL_56_26 TaxID=1817773 RepID=A0A1F6GL53_9PROT|nr:MAG: hypothetical protein A2557_13555 [Candidatus Lambdaproteobacteria bacterium RIFOXYD2_FULL_56_26]OGH04228.1 MAG: hypothetical protein A2426_02465 [Candidatus Lambdaproteobacteria bacterium RIFOXYC1_FULL_56_13]OGH08870.1 MAG: hypothetical protein A2600_06775 [Candidatus Lambdaproteobacteria bacterium RIFOXYD1_FULL_56_27]